MSRWVFAPHGGDSSPSRLPFETRIAVLTVMVLCLGMLLPASIVALCTSALLCTATSCSLLFSSSDEAEDARLETDAAGLDAGVAPDAMTVAVCDTMEVKAADDLAVEAGNDLTITARHVTPLTDVNMKITRLGTVIIDRGLDGQDESGNQNGAYWWQWSFCVDVAGTYEAEFTAMNGTNAVELSCEFDVFVGSSSCGS